MGIIAAVIRSIQREMGNELVLNGHCPSDVESESDFGCVGEVERDAAAFDHSALDIAPFDIKKTVSRRGRAKAIRDLGGLAPFERMRQHELVGSRHAARETSQNEAQRGDIHDRERLRDLSKGGDGYRLQ
jgi:hypothetical protein